MPTPFTIRDQVDLSGETLYATLSSPVAVLSTVPVSEDPPGEFSGQIPDSVPSGAVLVVAYQQLGEAPDPASDWEVARRSIQHFSGSLRVPEGIVVAANSDPTLGALLPGGVWFGQADDSALQHDAYAEVVMIPPGERREPLYSRGSVSAEIVTTPWGVAIYALDPERAEAARDAWHAAFRPGGIAPPASFSDGSGLSWWSTRGSHAQDNDHVGRSGDPVYTRAVVMMTRYVVEYPRGS